MATRKMAGATKKEIKIVIKCKKMQGLFHKRHTNYNHSEEKVLTYQIGKYQATLYVDKVVRKPPL